MCILKLLLYKQMTDFKVTTPTVFNRPRNILCTNKEKFEKQLFGFVTFPTIAQHSLSDLLVLTSSGAGWHSLRSTSMGNYEIPRSSTATKQHRAFSMAGPTIWTDFSLELCSSSENSPFWDIPGT